MVCLQSCGSSPSYSRQSPCQCVLRTVSPRTGEFVACCQQFVVTVVNCQQFVVTVVFSSCQQFVVTVVYCQQFVVTVVFSSCQQFVVTVVYCQQFVVTVVLSCCSLHWVASIHCCMHILSLSDVDVCFLCISFNQMKLITGHWPVSANAIY